MGHVLIYEIKHSLHFSKSLQFESALEMDIRLTAHQLKRWLGTQALQLHRDNLQHERDNC